MLLKQTLNRQAFEFKTLNLYKNLRSGALRFQRKYLRYLNSKGNHSKMKSPAYSMEELKDKLTL